MKNVTPALMLTIVQLVRSLYLNIDLDFLNAIYGLPLAKVLLHPKMFSFVEMCGF